MCEGSCTNTLDISNLPYMVNANRTALVGVRVDVIAECTCGARNFSKGESCRNSPCYNGGRCVEDRFGLSWVTIKPLRACIFTHIDFLYKSNLILIYSFSLMSQMSMSIWLQRAEVSANSQKLPRQRLGVVSRTGDVRQQSLELRVYHEEIGRTIVVQRSDCTSRGRRNHGFWWDSFLLNTE